MWQRHGGGEDGVTETANGTDRASADGGCGRVTRATSMTEAATGETVGARPPRRKKKGVSPADGRVPMARGLVRRAGCARGRLGSKLVNGHPRTPHPHSTRRAHGRTEGNGQRAVRRGPPPTAAPADPGASRLTRRACLVSTVHRWSVAVRACGGCHAQGRPVSAGGPAVMALAGNTAGNARHGAPPARRVEPLPAAARCWRPPGTTRNHSSR